MFYENLKEWDGKVEGRKERVITDLCCHMAEINTKL